MATITNKRLEVTEAKNGFIVRTSWQEEAPAASGNPVYPAQPCQQYKNEEAVAATPEEVAKLLAAWLGKQ